MNKVSAEDILSFLGIVIAFMGGGVPGLLLAILLIAIVRK